MLASGKQALPSVFTLQCLTAKLIIKLKSNVFRSTCFKLQHTLVYTCLEFNTGSIERHVGCFQDRLLAHMQDIHDACLHAYTDVRKPSM